MREEVAHTVVRVKDHGRRTLRDIKGTTLADANDYHGVFFVSDVTPPPCDTCENREHCKVNEVACARFLRYTQCEADWPEYGTEPSRDVYDLVFVENDHENYGAYDRTAAVRGDLAKLPQVAGELAIKDTLAEYAQERSKNYLKAQRVQGPAIRAALIEQGRVAKEEIDRHYSDVAIAERLGVTPSFVRNVRIKHSQYPGQTANGAVQAVGFWKANNKRVTVDR